MRSKLEDQITYWESNGSNRYGEETFAAPVITRARWEDRQEQVRTPSGDILISKAVVFVEDAMKIGDMVAKGDFTGISDPSMAGASEVQHTFSIPSMRTNQMEHRIVL